MMDDFRLDILFPDSYRDFIAEVYYGNKFVCIVSQDKGPESREIEWTIDSHCIGVKLPLDGFNAALQEAKRRLDALRADTN